MKIQTLRIWHISDSHSFHKEYIIPENIDIVIFSGDCSNHKIPELNVKEVTEFIDWFEQLNIPYKIFVAGNHDTSIEKKLYHPNLIKGCGIFYLEDNSVEIEGIKFYGSPRTPQFGHWAFMSDRNKIYKFWDAIPNDTDVLIVHGPPKGILDLTLNYDNLYERCGCSNLGKRIKSLPNIKLTCFGHIHNYKDIVNVGTRIIDGKIYSNATGVEDGKFDKGLIYNGNVFEYNVITKEIKIV